MATFISIIFPLAICFVGIWFFIKSKGVLKEAQRKKKELPSKLEFQGFKITQQFGMTGDDKAALLDDYALFIDSDSSRFAIASLTKGRSGLTAIFKGYDFDLDIFNFDDLISVQIEGDSNIRIINGASSPDSLYKVTMRLKNTKNSFVELPLIGMDRQGLNHVVARYAIKHRINLVNDMYDALLYIINNR